MRASTASISPRSFTMSSGGAPAAVVLTGGFAETLPDFLLAATDVPSYQKLILSGRRRRRRFPKWP
jgi:hypothetical protein